MSAVPRGYPPICTQTETFLRAVCVHKKTCNMQRATYDTQRATFSSLRSRQCETVRLRRQVHVSYVAEARLPGTYLAPAAVVTDLSQLVVFGATSAHTLVVL